MCAVEDCTSSFQFDETYKKDASNELQGQELSTDATSQTNEQHIEPTGKCCYQVNHVIKYFESTL